MIELLNIVNMQYGDPIINKIDIPLGNTIQYRVYKDYTRFDIQTGNNVKDLSILNRDLSRVILMDPDPRHYETTQPDNAIAMPAFEGRPGDTYLRDIVPFLETLAISGAPDVRPILKQYQGTDIPKKFSENTARYNEQLRDATLKVDGDQATDGSSKSGGWAAAVGRGLLAVMGMSRSPQTPQPVPLLQSFTPEEEERMKEEHLRSVMQTIEVRKRYVEEQVREQREMHEQMAAHAKSMLATFCIS
jgi:import inner membrane translocase subunit TIM50